MHHLVFGINSQIHSVSLANLVSIHLLIHLSAHLCHHHHSRYPSLFHSRLKSYLFNKSFPSHLNRLLVFLDCLYGSLDWTGLNM